MVTAFVRTVLLYFIIMFGLRLMGKRQIGELEPSELVLALLISDLAVVPMQDFGIPLINGVLPILVLLSISMMISVLNLKFIRFRKLVCGEACIIIRDGKVLQNKMRAVRLTIDELIQELRQQGITDISSVKYAILETNGNLSILQYAAYQPPPPRGIHADTDDTVTLPIVLISDGKVLKSNLTENGIDASLLYDQLSARKIDDVKRVFLMTIDQNGSIYLIMKE